MTKYCGQCACGKIKYCFAGKPFNAVYCYCKSCQIHTGSDKWFGLWIPIQPFAFTQGKPAIYERMGDSGKTVIHNFCHNCSTTLCIEVTSGRFYSVNANTLKPTSKITPEMAIYISEAPIWATLPKEIPLYKTLPPNIKERIKRAVL